MTKPIKLCSTLNMTHDAWLETRTHGIGGSDAPKIFGLVPYAESTPYALWLQKTGRIKPETGETSEAAHFGSLFEDVVAHEFMQRSQDIYGKYIKLQRSNYIYCHPDYPWMTANVDRVVVGDALAGFEAKTANAYKSEEWADDKVPDAYYIQCQHYMAVMDWKFVYIACLLGGQRFITKPILRNDELIHEMIIREKEFWETYVQGDKQPPMIAADDPALYYPDQKTDELLHATPEALALAQTLDAVRKEMKTLKTQEAELKNNLAQIIGTAAGIEGVCTWKQNKATERTDWHGLAVELGATPEQIKKYTAVTTGARVLRITLNKSRKEVA